MLDKILVLLIIYFAIAALTIECQSGGTQASQCKQNMCEMVGQTEVCTQCATGGNVPIDGVCVDKTTVVDTCLKDTGHSPENTDMIYGQCTNEHFLFKGGCYNVDTAPGNLICSGLDPENTALCKTCAADYFKNPANVATSDSCIVCSDTTGNGTNVGIANCATCNPPTAAAGKNRNAATCTACDGDNYLKTDENSQATSCVTAQNCGDGFFATTVEGIKRCVSCNDVINEGIASCQECLKAETTVTCSACNGNKKPNADGTKCIECSDEGVCLQCSTGKLTPTGQCVDSCDKLEGYYADSNVCQPCSPKCAKFSTAGADKCSTCPTDLLHPPVASAVPPSPACGARRLRVARSVWPPGRGVSNKYWALPRVSQGGTVVAVVCAWLSLCGSFSARLAGGEDRTRRAPSGALDTLKTPLCR